VSSPRVPSLRYGPPICGQHATQAPQARHHGICATIAELPLSILARSICMSTADSGFAGVRAHCLRELCRRCRSRWKACRTSPLGHGRSRRLRSSPSSLISGLARHPYLLRRRLPRLPRQRPGEGEMLYKTFKLASADEIPRQWISEVLHFCPGLPIILVGCKSDLRDDPKTMEELHKTSQRPVTQAQVR
jgi:hypothetical protein